MAIKVTREQRDAIYPELVLALNGTGDIQIDLDNGDHEAARRDRRRFEDAMRLLDDLGWEPDQEADEFELSMPAGQLARALRALSESAHAILHTDIVEPVERHRQTVRALAAQAATADLLGQAASARPDTER